MRAARELLVEAARRHSRVAHEVEDIAHDIIVSALRRGIPLDDVHMHGATRRHAAFLARSAIRRRARETFGAVADQYVDDDEHLDGGAPLSVLSPTLKTTLLLLSLGLTKTELCAALGVTDAALRKRFQALRAHAPLTRPTLPKRRVFTYLRRHQVKLLPQLAERRTFAASDPDGHGLIFTEIAHI